MCDIKWPPAKSYESSFYEILDLFLGMTAIKNDQTKPLNKRVHH